MVGRLGVKEPTVSVSPLGSVSLLSTGTVTLPPAGTVRSSSVVIGAALRTVTVTVAVAVPPWPSAMV